MGIEHQLCHAHGTHLGVCDYLYKTAKFPPRDANIPDLENIDADKEEEEEEEKEEKEEEEKEEEEVKEETENGGKNSSRW